MKLSDLEAARRAELEEEERERQAQKAKEDQLYAQAMEIVKSYVVRVLALEYDLDQADLEQALSVSADRHIYWSVIESVPVSLPGRAVASIWLPEHAEIFINLDLDYDADGWCYKMRSGYDIEGGAVASRITDLGLALVLAARRWQTWREKQLDDLANAQELALGSNS